MNRSIKFRVWDKLENQMMDWSSVRETELLDDAFDGKDAVAMQFTGLKDENGWEIYEGDILRVSTKSGETQYEVIYDISGFKGKNSFGYKFPLEYYAGHNLKKLGHVFEVTHLNLSDILSTKLYVVGNIFQNPELLKV